jgi:lipoprotein-releasing system permease protein
VYRRFLSGRYLKSRFVNLLSVGGVAAGVAVMIVVTCVMDGFQARVREVLRGTLSHVIMTPDGTVPSPPYADLDARIRSVDPRVVATSPIATAYVVHPFRRVGSGAGVSVRGYHPLEAYGIDWEREKTVSELATHIVAAEFPETPFRSARAELMERTSGLFSRRFLEYFLPGRKDPKDWLGEDVEFLVPKEVPSTTDPGETEFKSDTYRVVVSAVFDGGDQSEDLQRMYFDRETLRRIARVEPEYLQVRVRLSDYEHAPAVKTALKGAFAGMIVETWEDVRAQYLRAVNNEKVLLLVVLSFVVLLAGFTILATLTLTVVEKTRDIGLLKALGATTGGVLSLFLRSGAMIGVLGGVAGLALGLLFTHNVNGVKHFLERLGVQIFPADIYLFREIPTLVDPVSVAAIVLGGMFVAFLAGLPPALRASRMDPVVALRHE